MMNTPMNQEQLLRRIDQVSFALVDAQLFLDTHPNDEEAISYYRKQAALRQKAMQMYEEQYGPLNADFLPEGTHWDWVTQPWPWEGGYR